jgi:RimJ/RimL family protein N-acetyltransferase
LNHRKPVAVKYTWRMLGPWTNETERYRYSTRADLPDFAALLGDPEVGRWLWFTPLPEGAMDGFFGPLLDQQAEAVANGEAPLAAVFTIEDLDGRFLGQGAVIAVDMSPDGCEIGFQLTRAAWGRGVGRRLGEFLCAYAIEKGSAYRIEGGCLEGNDASASLLRKLGLKLEGTRSGYRLMRGERHTEIFFGRQVSEMDGERFRLVAEATGLRG